MSDSEEDPNIPSAEVCGQRCEQFAQLTGTDTALAMFYLQDREWDVERAVNAFYESRADEEDSSEPKKHENNKVADSGEQSFQDPEPDRIRLLSWNIDGLDTNNLKTRTKAVASIISSEKPDVVFLQEVVKDSEAVLEKMCTQYQLITAKHIGYYTAVMLRHNTVQYDSHTITPFCTRMGRNLLQVNACVKGIDMLLMTSHLESTKKCTTERQRQLKQCFRKMKEADANKTVIFGGDLNLRDKELASIGGVPDDMYDIWEVTGKRPEAEYTWDMERNDNCAMASNFRPRCRFDRIYLRHCKPNPKLNPVYFEFVGIERLKSCHRFPSDHWGILSHYNKI